MHSVRLPINLQWYEKRREGRTMSGYAGGYDRHLLEGNRLYMIGSLSESSGFR